VSERICMPIKPLSILHLLKPHVLIGLVVPEGFDPQQVKQKSTAERFAMHGKPTERL
jgi:hypothetical protein